MSLRKSVLGLDKKYPNTGEIEVSPINSNKENNIAEPKSNLTPFLLLAALSFHGFFEGTALGLQPNTQSTISLMIAILSHKWAEAFTLGISFGKTNTEKSLFIKLLLLFSLFTPIGIVFGFIISGFPGWVEALFFSLSVGTFFYIALTEIVVEEFSVTKQRWIKYILYLVGGVMISGLTIWQHSGEGHSHSH